MMDKIIALEHEKDLYHDLIQAYDRLMEECALNGDDNGFGKWLGRTLELERKIDWIDDEIARIRYEETY